VRSAPSIRRRRARVSWFSLKTKVNGFSWFGLKTGGYGSCGLASKSVAQVSRFGPQNQQLWFGDSAHKINVMFSSFRSQNQVGNGLSVAPQNRQEDEDGAGHASRSSGWLHLEVSQTRLSQSSLKTSGGAVRMMHMASSWRSRGDEAKDERVDATGCIRLFYPNFAIFIVLGHKGSLAISFLIIRTPRVGGEVSIQPSLSHPLAIVAF
jgi:hypothetical protein